MRWTAATAGVVVALALVLGGCGGGEAEPTAVRTWNQAKHYLRDLVEGKHPGEVRPADGAPPRVRALVEDRDAIANLTKKLEGLPDWGCEALDATERLPEDPTTSETPVTKRERAFIQIQAELVAQRDKETADDHAVNNVINQASQLRHTDLAAVFDVACKTRDL